MIQPVFQPCDKLGDVLHRSEEENFRSDSIGNFESQHCLRRWDAPLYRPVIDEALSRQSPAWPASIQWPEGRRFAACLTHDVDTGSIQSRRELMRAIGQHFRYSPGLSRLRHLGSVTGLRHTPGRRDIFSPWTEVEEKHGFRSTFFFFASRIRARHLRDNVYRWQDPTWYRGGRCRVRDVVQDLDKRGWEIGLHGSFLSATDYDMMAEQKADVEQWMSSPLISARQHNLHFHVEITPRVLEKAGVRVDSTMGFNRDIGFRAGTSYPFPVWDVKNKRPMQLTEIPLMLHDCAILRPDNLDLDCESAFWLCKLIIDRVAAVRGVVTLLWHPESYVRPGWFDLYERVLGYIREQNGWGASVRQVHDWWKTQGLDSQLQKQLEALPMRTG